MVNKKKTILTYIILPLKIQIRISDWKKILYVLYLTDGCRIKITKKKVRNKITNA